jgi:hypothetical protein
MHPSFKRLPVKLTIILLGLSIIYLISISDKTSFFKRPQQPCLTSTVKNKTQTTKATRRRIKTDNALHNIPRRIVQSTRDMSVSEKFETSRKSIQQMIDSQPKGHKYEYKVYTDAQQKAWVKTNYPHIYPQFMKFKYDIQRCDFWKFLIIYHYGGFYFDSDVQILHTIDTWYTYEQSNGRDINILIGIEADTPDDGLAKRPTWRPKQLVSWAFASVAKHPMLEYLLSLILSKRVARYLGDEDRNDTSQYGNEVGEFASPAALTDAVASYLLFKKSVDLGKLVRDGGDVMVDDFFLASIRAFACGNSWSIGINC